jgi:hypothetical protein
MRDWMEEHAEEEPEDVAFPALKVLVLEAPDAIEDLVSVLTNFTLES